MDIHDPLLLEGQHGFFAEIGSPCLSFTDADVYCNPAHIGHVLETISRGWSFVRTSIRGFLNTRHFLHDEVLSKKEVDRRRRR